MSVRNGIQDFSLANPIYSSATVTFYTVSGGVKTTTKATLYSALTGTDTLLNPQHLDVQGKVVQAIYVDVPVVATISGLTIADHDTGIIQNILSTPVVTGNALEIVRIDAAGTGFEAKTAAQLGLEELSHKDASGGYAGLTLFKLNLRNALNTITSFFTNAATVARTWTLPDKDGTVAMTNDKLSAFAATSSAELAGVVSDGRTGTGALVCASSPTLVAPSLGTPNSGVTDNLTTSTTTAAINDSDFVDTNLAAGGKRKILWTAVVTYITSKLDLTGWISDVNAWTYASASTFTVPGDRTATFKKGVKLAWFQTTQHYGHVASSSFGAGVTTVTILVNTDYVIANAAITVPQFSFADSPAGFPSQFQYTSTVVGFTVGTLGASYTIRGGNCLIFFANTGTSNAANFTFSVPIVCATNNPAAYTFSANAAIYDNSAWQTLPGVIGLANGSTTANVGKTTATLAGNAFAGFTAAGGKGIDALLEYPF